MKRATWKVGCFFLLSYVLTWFGNLGNLLYPSPNWPVPMNPLGPLLAAPLAIGWFDGWPGVKAWLWRILQFRAPLWVYACAFFVPLAIILVSVGIAILIGTPHGPLPTYTLAEYFLYVPIVLIDGPAPEEPSFRGFGQHELQTEMSPLAAAFAIGAGVLIWHLPVMLRGDIPPTVAVALIAVPVVYAWLYAAGGSVWPLVLAHAVQNYFGGGIFGRIFAPEDGWIWIAFLAGFYVLWAVVLIALHGKSLGRGPVVANVSRT